MSELNPNRFRIESPASEVISLLKVMVALLERIAKNTEKGKPGRPKREKPSART